MLQRTSRVTATDIAKIRSGTDKAFAALWKYKHEPIRQFTNRWIEHGKKREPVIAKELSRLYPGLEHNDKLLLNEDDQRLAATPDMLSGDGRAVGEIKTHLAKTDDECWSSAEEAFKSKPEYSWQCQYQLLVTGAEMCVFCWEDYSIEDGWEDIRPIQHEVVRPDPALHDLMRDLVDRYMAYRPPQLVEGDAADFETQAIAQRLAEIEAELQDARRLVKSLDDDRKAAQADLIAAMGDGPSLTRFPGIVVEVSAGRRSRSFDRKSFEADFSDDPAILEKYMVEKDGAPSVKVTMEEE